MRILWVCNQCVPQIAGQLNIPGSNKEGWVAGLYDAVTASGEDFTLGICFPGEEDGNFGNAGSGETRVYRFAEDLSHPENYEERVTTRLREIMDDFRPDLVHVFGTEYGHTLSAAKAIKDPSKLLIGFQGVCTALAKAYLTGVEEEWIHKSTFRDRLKDDNMQKQKEKFELRGQHEKEALSLAGFVTGRTRLDRRYTEEFAPDAEYLFMNETMRGIFYSGAWELSRADKRRIFVSQCDYPIKGFHVLVRALGILKTEFPDLKVYVAGNTITGVGGLKKKVLIPTYGQYLRHLMKESGTEEMIHFLGPLSGEEMKEEFLKAGVFVLPSVMENSPNCLGEAMLLGVPCVASDVGGVADILKNETEGWLYENNDPALLAEALREVLGDLEGGGVKCLERTAGAKISARKKHDGKTNAERLFEIYRIIGGKNRKE